MAEVAKPGGTLRYMAPEVLKGVPANARTEVFSLAVTIYRMFAGGAYPFGQHEKWPLSRMRPDLPSWLGEIIARGIKTDPAERFEDAAAMAAALQEGLVAGIAKPLEPKTILGLNPLRFWQILAAIFGIGFFVMLARTLR
jgi:serine/threonine protein kinase